MLNKKTNSKSQLGIFWGEQSFSIVENSGGQVTNISSLPFNESLKTDQSQDVPQELKYIALLQQTISEQNISAAKVNLALSAKDLIFRSFVIPWMQPEEVKNVVDFEATKYVPLKLEELFFTYHPIPFSDNNQKNLRILFVAVRKKVIEDYSAVLEQAGLILEHIEPASVSIIRVLQKQGQLSQKNSSAIIEMEKGGGKIIIVDNDVVQFVREFQIQTGESDPALLNAKLFNDLRVSFNFYSRQNPQGKVERIITLFTGNLPIEPDDLSKELGIPVAALAAENILGISQVPDIGLLSAYGATLREKGFSTKDFELSEKATKRQKAGKAALAQVKYYQIMAGIVALCALAIFGTITLSKKTVVGHREKIAELEQKQGAFRSSKVGQIETMKTEISTKLNTYKDIRADSNIRFFLTKIPALLLKGTWIKDIKILYSDETTVVDGITKNITKTSLTLDGYAYVEDSNEQFRLVNNLVAHLKNEEEFASLFTDINLETVQQVTIDGYLATNFRITCK